MEDSHVCMNVTQYTFLFLFCLQEGVKYTLRLKNHGPKTLNGDGGMNKVKCPDGTTFTFSACSLSSNGSNHMRGQIPQILYYRYGLMGIDN
jgi:predicted secreted hydrolase